MPEDEYERLYREFMREWLQDCVSASSDPEPIQAPDLSRWIPEVKEMEKRRMANKIKKSPLAVGDVEYFEDDNFRRDFGIAYNSFSQEIEVGCHSRYLNRLGIGLGEFNRRVRNSLENAGLILGTGFDGSGPYEITLKPISYDNFIETSLKLISVIKKYNPFIYYNNNGEQAGNHLHVSVPLDSKLKDYKYHHSFPNKLLEHTTIFYNNLVELLPIFAPWFTICCKGKYYRFRNTIGRWARVPPRMSPASMKFWHEREYWSVSPNLNRKRVLTLEVRINEAPFVKSLIPCLAIGILSVKYGWSLKLDLDFRRSLYTWLVYDPKPQIFFDYLEEPKDKVVKIQKYAERNPYNLKNDTLTGIWRQIFTKALKLCEKDDLLSKHIPVFEFALDTTTRVEHYKSFTPLRTSNFIMRFEKSFRR